EYVREHNEAVNRLDFIDVRAEITVDFAEGELIDVTQHDGSIIRLRKLSASFNPNDRVAAMNYVHERQAKGEVVTGLLYVDAEAHDLHEHFNTAPTPLNRFEAAQLSPGSAVLAKINASLR
ncbi:MAG TPA: 2-oxoacid:ferredoxin oxidoreductase subunit beta, partial [Rudaea sp.]